MSGRKDKFSRWQAAFDSQKILDDVYSKKEVTKTINCGDKPLIVMFSGDWHIGARDTDHEALFNDIENLIQYSPEDIRLNLLGDLCDNFMLAFKSADPVFGHIRPELQYKLLAEILEDLYPFVDSAFWGNHEVFTEKILGFSNVAEILKKKITYFPGKGVITYNVGNQKYRMMMSHMMRGSSMYHDLHSNIRAWQENPVDVVASAHLHTPSYLGDYRGVDDFGKPWKRHLLKVGSYKKSDLFSIRYFKSGVIGNDSLVLYPDKHKILHFPSLEDALDHLSVKKPPKINTVDKKTISRIKSSTKIPPTKPKKIPQTKKSATPITAKKSRKK